MSKKETRTYADRAEYLKKAVAKRRKTLRTKAIEYKGNECLFCGYNRCREALDFHHIHKKNFGLSEKGMTRSWEKTKEELDKCILVCANCHREIHAGKLQLPTVMLVENGVNCGKPKVVRPRQSAAKPIRAISKRLIDRKVQRLGSESQQ